MIKPDYISRNGRIRFYNCDCNDLMNCGKKWDLAVVDPPYGINVAKMAYTQEENRTCKQKNGGKLIVRKLKYRHGDWDCVPANEDYIKLLKLVSKNQIIWGINYMDFHLKGGRIIWNKLNGENSFSDAEIAYCSLHERVRVFDFLWSGMFQGKSAANGAVQQGNKKLNQKRIHPTEKPIELYRWLFLNYAKPTDHILDTHGGSMSSAIAAHMEGLELDICEMDKDYFDAAVNRFKIYEQQQTLF